MTAAAIEEVLARASTLLRHEASALADQFLAGSASMFRPASAMCSEEAEAAGLALRRTDPAAWQRCGSSCGEARHRTAAHGRYAAVVAVQRVVLATAAGPCITTERRRGSARLDWSLDAWERMTHAWRATIGPLTAPAAAQPGLFDTDMDDSPARGPAHSAFDCRASTIGAEPRSQTVRVAAAAWRVEVPSRGAGLVQQGRAVIVPGAPGSAVLIACGRDKRPAAAPAADLYVGSQFRLALRTARAITDEASVFIVSAKHGVIPADRVLAPYDAVMPSNGVTLLPTDPAVTARVNEHRCVVSLLPAAYDLAAAAAGVRLDVRPFVGCGGIGQQRQVLAQLAAAAQEIAIEADGISPGSPDPLADDSPATACGPSAAPGSRL